MSLVTLTPVNPNDEVTADSVNSQPAAIAAVVNGGIDDANISGVSGTKIANGTITTAKYADASVTAAKLALGAQTATVGTTENTSSGSYVDLATTTDTVTATIGANGMAFVIIQATITNTTVNVGNFISVAVSGATTMAAGSSTVPKAVYNSASTSSANANTIVGHKLVTGLTAGSNTFKMKYAVGGGSNGYFVDRIITVIPL